MGSMFLAADSLDVSSSLTTAGTVITSVISWVTANPVLTACFVLGTLVPAGVYAFRKLKSSAK